MGLERLAVVLQGVKSNYETDLIRPIIEFTAKLADRNYEPETQEGFAMRVIADHARATAFLIADGILPGNEGRNYVLRKIMRRAIYQGRHTLGFKDSFFHKVTNFVVDQMHEALSGTGSSARLHREDGEAGRGAVWLDADGWLEEAGRAVSRQPTGRNARLQSELARLYDTFGTPRDLDSRGLGRARLYESTKMQFNRSPSITLCRS